MSDAKDNHAGRRTPSASAAPAPDAPRPSTQPDGHGSQPIHRAIDRLTAVMLDLQHLRRRAESYDGLAADLERVDSNLRELGAALVELRETDD